ncbi:LOW QUALITY PROTEIN: radial spoke head protein 3 homolog B-like [Homalodisca vitripennis]|uniref:LOW QUALITY PROTEIN: radial spoke head protein 3 homolog B-like n=1 Tax=Homalodisca vitripennis TaxID=197043 RepID=UPI001EEA25A8|nr:LOW QUALITY PROTEIN: radial spoke head protein 3 homolog B-like [Homalodisca vitripennis]
MVASRSRFSTTSRSSGLRERQRIASTIWLPLQTTSTRNHHYYHKNCFSSVNDLDSFNRKLSPNVRKENNMSKEFFNSLDSKLRTLNAPPPAPRQKRSNPGKSLDNRPMFVTTVKTGIFLEPPPELAAILGLNSYTSSVNGSSGSSGSLHPSNIGEEVLVYSFASQPRVVNQKYRVPKAAPTRPQDNKNKTTVPNGNNNNNINKIRTKRELNTTPPKKLDGTPLPYGNIMYDRRVVRGSTFAQHPVPAAGCESQAARQAEARRRSMARRKAQTQQTRAMRLRIGTPPPVDGRNHVIVQTDQFMEELFDHPPGATVSCQTDFFLDRPETPIYVPSKTGRDARTQIYPGELFHFDTEVQPILEVLVGKTVEQALVEVMEEDELAAIREQQRRYKEIRAAEKAEEQRLEEQERRRREEAAKRVEELELTNRIRLETEDRVSAAVLTQGYLTDLLPSVLEGLKEAGYFIDDIREDVEENFMSWLMGEVRQEMQRMVDNRDLLSEIVREILETRAEVYRAMATDKPGPGSDEEPTSTPLPGVSSVVLHKDENTEETDETGETKPKEETEVRQSAGDDEPTAES